MRFHCVKKGYDNKNYCKKNNICKRKILLLQSAQVVTFLQS